MRFFVNRPATLQGFSEYKMPRSGPPFVLIPAATAPARNPFGEVIVPSTKFFTSAIYHRYAGVAITHDRWCSGSYACYNIAASFVDEFGYETV